MINTNIVEREKGLLIKNGKQTKNIEINSNNKLMNHKMRSKREISINQNILKNKAHNEIARLMKTGFANSLPKICADSVFLAKKFKFLQTFLENDNIWFKRGD